MSIYLQHILQIRQLWIRELGLLVVDIVLYLVDQLGVIRYLYYNISDYYLIGPEKYNLFFLLYKTKI